MSFLSRLFPRRAESSVPFVPPSEPPLSCFIQGLVKSLTDEARWDEWREDWQGDTQRIQHAKTPIAIYYTLSKGSYSDYYLYCPFYDFSRFDERGAVIEALKRRAALQKEKDFAPLAKYFGDIGCPSKEGVTSAS